MARKDANPPGTTEKMAERRLEVLKLRKAGHSYRQIASLVGVALCTIQKDLAFTLGELAKEQLAEASELRVLELARLSDLLQAVYAKALTSSEDPSALSYWDRALKAIDARCRLLGLHRQPTSELSAVETLVDSGWLPPQTLRSVTGKLSELQTAVQDALKNAQGGSSDA
jgi:hypothetical protein